MWNQNIGLRSVLMRLWYQKYQERLFPSDSAQQALAEKTNNQQEEQLCDGLYKFLASQYSNCAKLMSVCVTASTEYSSGIIPKDIRLERGFKTLNLITRNSVAKTDCFFSPRLLFSLLTMTSPEFLGHNFYCFGKHCCIFYESTSFG